MKIAIISYSLTGNNEALASALATHYRSEHIRISETKARSTGRILSDLFFRRVPPINFHFTEAGQYDLIIFVGPVWGGVAATPFRSCFRDLKACIGEYAFVSISGGAAGQNRKLDRDLAKRLGKDPVSVIDLHIANLLPQGSNPHPSVTSSYRISKEDTRRLAETAINELAGYVEAQKSAVG